jgi:Rhodanese-like domain
MPMKLFIGSIATLVVLSFAVACESQKTTSGATAANHSAQTATVNTSPSGSITQDTSVHQGTLDSARRISVSELKAELEKGEVVIVDTRPAASYKTSHIKGAMSIPYDEFGRRMKEIPKGKTIVTYCS